MKNRYFMAMATFLLSLFTGTSLWAQDNSTAMSGTCGDNIKWTISDEGVLTLTGTGAMTNYDTGDNQGPWRYRTDIKKIVVGDGITSIGDYAFFSSSAITEVELPATVETIGNGAFENIQCTEIQLSSALTTIKERAFGGSQLTSITIPEKVARIEDYAFSNCHLSSLHIAASVTYLGKHLLENGNSELAIITVDANNTTYDSRDNCNAIIETKTNTLVEGCKTTVIPSTVTAIGRCAFSRSGIAKVIIPETVTSIGESAFYGCKEVVFNSTTPPTLESGALDGLNEYNSSIVRVPNSAVDAYRKAGFEDKIGNVFRTMSARTHAIYNNDGTTVNIFYDDKTAINSGWYGCEITKDNFTISDEIGQSIYDIIGIKDPLTTITTIEFDESMKDYRRTNCNNMFENLGALKTIKGLDHFNTENVTTMTNMFRYCSKLKYLDLSSFDTKNVQYMNGMFMGCTELKDIFVSNAFSVENVKSTSDPIFYKNENLKHAEGDREYANYIDGNFKKKVGTLDGEPFGATGKDLTIESLDLTNASSYELTETAPVTATAINYNRTMTSTWGTLCLPYDINPKQAGNNCRYYTIKSITNEAITLEPATSTIAAGTPVLFKRTDNADAATINGEGLLGAIAKTSGNLVGTFATQIVPSDAYFIANDAFRLASDYKTVLKNVKVATFRAYIQPTAEQCLGANKLTIKVGDATAIDAATVFGAIDDGAAEYYDASGKHTDGLHKGLNIVRTKGKTMKIYLK